MSYGNDSKIGVSPTTTEVKQGEVQTQMSRLGDSIYELDQLITGLENRLDPVLMPQVIGKETGDEARLNLSPLAEAIRGTEDRVNSLRGRVKNILEHLAV